MVDVLFSGSPEPFGGLSNEKDLARLCPEEFRRKNPWSDYAMRLFFRGGRISNWKWKSNIDTEKRHQKACFRALLGTFDLPHEDKKAVAGWMLSEMLTELPLYIPDTRDS